MIHIIGQIIFGLIVGAIARWLIPGKEPIAAGMMGWVITCLLGIAGSLLGSFIGRAIWGSEKYAAGWIMSILGAILLLLLYRMVM
ncbi:MAG TPA: GlsB/YeaQ/YmgE family stress response membrane protein [Pyrinomonadaceae bacterium]|nr:GlsB/YeaQ/YmgE family stress response membrane protein [Pyrinomonadaceae bacterium]